MRPIKAELVTGPPDDARVENLVRAGQRNLRLSSTVMDGYHDVAFMAVFGSVIEPASLICQPFLECCALHLYTPCQRTVIWRRS